MENRKRFIVVVLILMCAIMGTVGMSVALMLETYRSLRADFSASVQSALDEAIRLEREMSGASKLDIRLPSAGILRWKALEGISPDEISAIDIRKGGEGSTSTISVSFRSDSSRTQAKPNVLILRTFLDELFKSRGIHEAYSLLVTRRRGHQFVMMGDADSTSVSSIRILGAGGQTTLISYGDSLSSMPSASDTLYDDHRPIPHALEFRAGVGGNTQAECRLLIGSPHRVLWKRMSGVVVASVLIALVLCFSFAYLLRTLLRMKSLEAMRRDFTHNITHELKTPIAAISATNEALTDFAGSDDPERRRKYLAVQKHYLQSLSFMVERILSLSMQESRDFRLHPESCSLQALIAEEMRTLPLKYPQKIQMDTDWPDEELRVNVDRFHFSNVLFNFLDNAVKYGASEPHIRIEAGLAPGGKIFIRIRDNGKGIPPSQRKHIFEKYYRIPTGDVHNVRGYGIGLYYCRLVVEKMGGSIGVSDNPGGGSVFTIVF